MPQSLGFPKVSYGKTLAEMREDLRFQLRNRTDLTNGRLDGWINDAYIELAADLEIKQFRQGLILETEADVDEYPLPQGIVAVNSASRIDDGDWNGGYPLILVDEDAYERLPEESGEPTHYTVYSDIFVLWPTPPAGLLVGLDCWMLPMKMTLDSHSPLVDPGLHRSIVLKARAIAWDALGNPEAAAIASNEYTRSIRSKLDRRSQDKATMVARVTRPRNWREVYGVTLPRRTDAS